jgi:FxLD family lantipeptide
MFVLAWMDLCRQFHGPTSTIDQPTEGTDMTTNQPATAPHTRPMDDLDLDVSIVEEGDAAAVLLASTDNGCDTNKGGDC